jgi:hypothetical protein
LTENVAKNLHPERSSLGHDLGRREALTLHPMFSFVKRLRNADHIRRYSIVPTGSGWEVREEQDSRVVRQVHYTDWHRVERARRAFTLEVSNLREQGWEAIAD